MKKIISLFQRNYDGDRLVRDDVVPGAEWVLAGEGVPTRKYDGTCCLVRGGQLFKRYEIRQGKKAPANFEPATDIDENTGKQQGWVPIGEGPEDKWHRQGLNRSLHSLGGMPLADGTYELVGPNVQGNPEHYHEHFLIPHLQAEIIADAPRSFAMLREFFGAHDIEGIVWHHPDGRMVKIKAKDFGKKRKP